MVDAEAASSPPDKDDASFDDAIDSQEEKRILRKIDVNLITLFGVLYLMSFLGWSKFLRETK